MGEQFPLMYCCSTAPTAMSDASVIRQVGASGTGWTRSDASASVYLISEKAVTAVSDQFRVSEGCGLCLRRLLRDWRIAA